LNRAPNAEFGPKDFFEIGSRCSLAQAANKLASAANDTCEFDIILIPTEGGTLNGRLKSGGIAAGLEHPL